jgi:phage tail sheath protein FI
MTTPVYPYKRPGVYVSETLLPLPTPAVAPGTAVAAFVGTHNAGPTTPTLISSWAQFLSLYGGFGSGIDVLPFSVYEYFANGGNRAYILRAVASDAAAASVTLNNVPIPPASTQTPTPPGTAPTGSGTAPSNPVAGVTLTSVTSPVINPEQTALGVTFQSLTGTGNAIDAYLVTCTPPAGSGLTTQQVWFPQPGTQGACNIVFGGLQPGTTYTIQVVPYKGTSAGPGIASPPTFSTLAPYTAVPALKITALGLGAYGNNIYIDTAASWTSGRFHLFVKVGSDAAASLVETWQDVSLNPTDPRYVVSMLNAPQGGSAYIQVQNMLPPASPQPGTGQTPDGSWFPVLGNGFRLASGSDGVQAVNLSTSLTNQFASIADVLLLNLCGQFTANSGIPAQTVINAALSWVINRGRAFMVLDAPQVPAPADSTAATSAYLSLLPSATPPGSYQPTTSYAAMYGPWLQCSDPAGASVQATRMLPPAGAVMGQFAQADAKVGPNQAPAGVGYPLIGVVGVEHQFTNDQLDSLNIAGMDVIRPVPASGFCIMGVRTLKAGMPDRYIPIRRMLTYLEDLLTKATQFALFAPNGPQLWQTITAVCQQQLNVAMMSGQLAGSTPDQAFFVICDDTNNTPASVANGEIHISVGAALETPGEFIVLQISQYQGGISTTTTSL